MAYDERVCVCVHFCLCSCAGSEPWGSPLRPPALAADDLLKERPPALTDREIQWQKQSSMTQLCMTLATNPFSSFKHVLQSLAFQFSATSPTDMRGKATVTYNQQNDAQMHMLTCTGLPSTSFWIAYLLVLKGLFLSSYFFWHHRSQKWMNRSDKGPLQCLMW